MSVEEGVVSNSERSTKKRKSFGRMTEVNKKIRVQSHESGPDCKCKRLKCFEVITEDQRSKIIRDFNLMLTRDSQNLYLCGLISVCEIQRRRPRNEENGAKLHSATFSYRVRVLRDEETVDQQVCFQAFLSIHGITRRRLVTLQKSLLHTGNAPVDMRGKHSNRPKKLTSDTKDLVKKHISSFQGRKSHYSLQDTKKIYLPEDLNVKKMFILFKKKYPQASLSYETYRSVFVTEFNIGFGYPRTDTCSSCDEFAATLKALKIDMKRASSGNDKISIQCKIAKLTAENDVHKTKAKVFYERKRKTRISCQTSTIREAITMDFQKNLSMPNITTNDVYYKRQLTLNLFNIHVLSTSESYFFTYPETIAKKGSDEVCSFLHYFIFNILSENVRELVIFCDSCGGQNKNYTMFRFIHFVIHTAKRLNMIKIIFPIRGHSYLECDRNMGIINQKSPCETPGDWMSVIRNARQKPTPFRVIDVDQPMVRTWTKFFTFDYIKKCPFLSRPIREIRVEKDHPRLIFHRNTYNNSWSSSVMVEARKNRRIPAAPAISSSSEFILPEQAYRDTLPITKAKFKDVKSLCKFCGPKGKLYFSKLKYTE